MKRDSSPLVLRFDRQDPPAIDRMLGTASKEIVAGRVSVLVIDVSVGADPKLGHAVHGWLERNRTAIRHGVDAFAIVAPSWWAALLLKLDFSGDPPPTEWAVVRSVDAALRWAEEVIQTA
jgi:hypothetical protein